MNLTWFLDIDGVLNVGPGRKDNVNVWPEWQRGDAVDSRGKTYSMRWATAVVDFITQVHERGGVKIYWLSTWEEAAPGVGDLVGLPLFETLLDPNRATFGREKRRPTTWWKWDVVMDCIRPGEPFVWTDDELAFESKARNWAQRHGLPIAPHATSGLAKRHLTEIDEFVTATLAKRSR